MSLCRLKWPFNLFMKNSLIYAQWTMNNEHYSKGGEKNSCFFVFCIFRFFFCIFYYFFEPIHLSQNSLNVNGH